MRPTNFLLDESDGIGRLRFDRDGSTETRGKFELLIVDIDGGHVETHGLCILHCHMPEAADAGNNNPVTGFRIRHLQPLVYRHAGAQDWRDLDEPDPLRQVTYVIRIGEGVFSETAVHGISGVLLRFAECFPSAQTMIAVSARGVQPWNTNAIAFLNVTHPGPDFSHVADTLVSRDEGRIRLDRPVSVGSVQVRMANAAGFDLDKHLPRTGSWHGDFLDLQWLTEFTHYRGFHRLAHRSPLINALFKQLGLSRGTLWI